MAERKLEIKKTSTTMSLWFKQTNLAKNFNKIKQIIQRFCHFPLKPKTKQKHSHLSTYKCSQQQQQQQKQPGSKTM